MPSLSFINTPFQIKLSFYQVISRLEADAKGTGEKADKARQLLEDVAPYPELRDGITDASQVTENADLIRRLLEDYFAPALTENEIRAVAIPYRNIIFNYTKRFQKLLDASGKGFEMNIRDFDEHQFYVMSCCIILNEFYNTRLDFSKPIFYDIPTANGIAKHYRIMYNADFLDILPTEKTVPLTPEDIDLLINNYDNLELWKQKFPLESWVLKGFAIMTLFDATVENAVSILKEKLLRISADGFRESIESIFQSIFGIKDIRVGFTAYNADDGMFSPDVFGQQLPSYMLADRNVEDAESLLSSASYKALILKKQYFAVSDNSVFLSNNPKSRVAQRFVDQNIHSCILAPLVKNNLFFGLLEVVSSVPKQLNSINAHKLEVVMPYIIDTVERLSAELQNEVQAVIQDRFTTIHSSVYWKFKSEAQNIIYNRQINQDYVVNNIVFNEVFPLYGQVDIKGSSDARNISVQKDLQEQLCALLSLLEHVILVEQSDDSYREYLAYINHTLDELLSPVRASTEQVITNYLATKVHPHLLQISNVELQALVNAYLQETVKETGRFHVYRKKYEHTISKINNKMAHIIDASQTQAQSMFPHYYERFKTDGVEHNLYIGQSIAPAMAFDITNLFQLRFWQLQVLCEMENAHHHLKSQLPYQLEVTTLVLVYHATLAIRFRMDEKRFDVDGSYNARFEIVKKRIDKAHIKGTNERITQVGKITIVYSNDVEEEEYLGYIQTLQRQNFLEKNIEKFDVEDLQGVSGLKALRVNILH